MAKHDRRKRSSQPRSSRTVTIQVPLPVLGVLNGVREAFHGLCIKTGMQVLEAMMEGDREDLCGPKGRHQAERPAWRGGNVASQVTLGGRQVAVPRLRVRRADGEAPLPSFQWAAATDPLDEHTLAAVAAGVSTRRYAGTLDPAPAEVEERGTSSSAVSRRFVALSAKRLRSFLSRPLGELARGGVGFSGPDRGAVQRGEGGGGAALRAGLCARERLRAVRGARRRGRGVRMSESLVPAIAEPVVVED